MAISLEHRLEILDDVLKSDIFYYPTYRRIESALVNFQEISKKLSEINPFIEKIDLSKLFNSDGIQFGMDDVKKRIDNVTDIIYQTTMDGFSSIMGDMLSQLSKTIKSDEIKYNFDKKLIQIILDRLNDKIKPADKESIMAYATSGKLNNPNLNFLIAKLVSLYEEQKQYDKAIKCFRDTCNHYLNEVLLKFWYIYVSKFEETFICKREIDALPPIIRFAVFILLTEPSRIPLFNLLAIELLMAE